MVELPFTTFFSPHSLLLHHVTNLSALPHIPPSMLFLLVCPLSRPILVFSFSHIFLETTSLVIAFLLIIQSLPLSLLILFRLWNFTQLCPVFSNTLDLMCCTISCPFSLSSGPVSLKNSLYPFYFLIFSLLFILQPSDICILPQFFGNYIC